MRYNLLSIFQYIIFKIPYWCDWFVDILSELFIYLLFRLFTAIYFLFFFCFLNCSTSCAFAAMEWIEPSLPDYLKDWMIAPFKKHKN